MDATLSTLFAPPRLHTLSLSALHIVMATRMCALCNIGGEAPLPLLAQRINSETAARAILDLVAAVGDAWAEPFMVGRPCCPVLTADEAAIAVLVSAAQIGDEPTGLASLRELLPPSVCVDLYRLAQRAVVAVAPLSIARAVSRAPNA